MPDQNCMSHSSENCFGKPSEQKSTKEGILGALDNRSDAVKHYNKSEHKCKKYLKAHNNQNKMLYIISKNSGSRLELK